MAASKRSRARSTGPRLAAGMPGERPLNAGLLELLEGARVGRSVRYVYLDRAFSVGAEFPDAVKEVGRAEVGEPRVPEGQNAVEHSRPVAADENRGVRTLSGLGPGPDGTE